MTLAEEQSASDVAQKDDAGAVDASRTTSVTGFSVPVDLFKARRCKSIIMQKECQFGDNCVYAHTPAELRKQPNAWEETNAEHWQSHGGGGRVHVAIGVVEYAMFWDLPPPGTTDVICNRTTCLGNPFSLRIYEPDEPRPPNDADGWNPTEHQEIVAAFSEYFDVVVGDSGLVGSSALDPDEDLRILASRIGKERKLTLAETWEAQNLKRRDVLAGFAVLGENLTKGKRLRLLCHCRPHVRCHVELLKAYLEKHYSCEKDEPIPVEEVGMDATGRVWPGFGKNFATCAVRTNKFQCKRDGRALDPSTQDSYCVQCWTIHASTVHWPGMDDDWPESGRPEPVQPGWGASRKRTVDAVDKTPCKYFAKGYCSWGADCRNIHEVVEKPPAPADGRTDTSVDNRPPCKFFANGYCGWGEACSSSHDPSIKNSSSEWLYKKSQAERGYYNRSPSTAEKKAFCTFQKARGNCMFGESCWYSHDVEVEAPETGDTVDPAPALPAVDS